jgi:hypothetical protein
LGYSLAIDSYCIPYSLSHAPLLSGYVATA